MSENALVRTQQPAEEKAPAAKAKPVDLLAKRYEKVQNRDLDIVDGMNRFCEVPTPAEPEEREKILALLNRPDADIKAAGWRNRKELRAAIYGTLPRSKWPAAMQAAHERVGMRLRKQEKKAGTQTFNLTQIVIPAPQRPTEADRVVIVEAKDPEKR